VGGATSICKGAAVVVAASPTFVPRPAGKSVVRANPKSGGEAASSDRGRAAVALVIGTIEIGGLISSDLDLSGTFWDWFENADINVLGFVIVAMFVTTSAIAALVWRLGGIEERWSAHLEDSRPREGSPWTSADRR
jgi:High-affinity nickel-transport protein